MAGVAVDSSAVLSVISFANDGVLLAAPSAAAASSDGSTPGEEPQYAVAVVDGLLALLKRAADQGIAPVGTAARQSQRQRATRQRLCSTSICAV